jgi:hypothetical protein
VTRWAGVAARGRLRGKLIPVLDDDNRPVKKAPAPLDVSRKQRRQKQEVSKTVPDPAAVIVERIIPGSSDGLDTFIDYCESRCRLQKWLPRRRWNSVN